MIRLNLWGLVVGWVCNGNVYLNLYHNSCMSSRMRHVYHNYHNENGLKIINELGYEIIQTDPDGNCTCRSLSEILFNTPEFHMNLRQMGIDIVEKYMLKTFPNYDALIINEDESLEAKLGLLRNSGVYIGNETWYALSHVLGFEYETVTLGGINQESYTLASSLNHTSYKPWFEHTFKRFSFQQ